ncbi:hypothetical protein WJX84_003522 [Apatococcus fuscideae]|uniref:Uncharacterized protein n=1 Tax=Apatococcus fuscideae TaxID=2026836 RepID=A0AAW1SSH5_9CHLO
MALAQGEQQCVLLWHLKPQPGQPSFGTRKSTQLQVWCEDSQHWSSPMDSSAMPSKVHLFSTTAGSPTNDIARPRLSAAAGADAYRGPIFGICRLEQDHSASAGQGLPLDWHPLRFRPRKVALAVALGPAVTSQEPDRSLAARPGPLATPLQPPTQRPPAMRSLAGPQILRCQAFKVEDGLEEMLRLQPTAAPTLRSSAGNQLRPASSPPLQRPISDPSHTALLAISVHIQQHTMAGSTKPMPETTTFTIRPALNATNLTKLPTLTYVNLASGSGMHLVVYEDPHPPLVLSNTTGVP